MRMTIVPFEGVDTQLVQAIVQRLRDILPWQFVTASQCADLAPSTQTATVQVEEVFALLHTNHQVNEITIGMTSRDLAAPGFDYVFGYASPDRRAGAVSLFRLTNGEDSQNVLVERAAKEVLHEVGHVLGLRHCDDPCCVMTYSQALQDTDIKSFQYCEHCSRELSRMPETVADG